MNVWKRIIMILGLVLLIGVFVFTESNTILVTEEDDHIEWNSHGEKDICKSLEIFLQ